MKKSSIFSSICSIIIILLMSCNLNAAPVLVAEKTLYKNLTTGESYKTTVYLDGTTMYVRLQYYSAAGVELTNAGALHTDPNLGKFQTKTMVANCSADSNFGSIVIPTIGTVWGFTATVTPHATAYFQVQVNLLLQFGPDALADTSNIISVAFVTDVNPVPVIATSLNVSSLLVSDIKAQYPLVGELFMPSLPLWEITTNTALNSSSYNTRVPSTPIANSTMLIDGGTYDITNGATVVAYRLTVTIHYVVASVPLPYGGVGIETPTPQTTLDVNGDIKIGNSNQPCTVAINPGAIRYNTTTKHCEVCTDALGTWQWTQLRYVGE